MLITIPKQIQVEVDPTQIEERLIASGWVLESNTPSSIKVFHRNDSELAEVVVPLRSSYVDYERLLLEAINVIALYEGRTLWDVANEIKPLT